jgi:hypothetical protein
MSDRDRLAKAFALAFPVLDPFDRASLNMAIDEFRNPHPICQLGNHRPKVRDDIGPRRPLPKDQLYPRAIWRPAYFEGARELAAPIDRGEFDPRLTINPMPPREFASNEQSHAATDFQGQVGRHLTRQTSRDRSVRPIMVRQEP